MGKVLFMTIMAGVGLLCIWFGYLIWHKEKINLIHDYHYTKVKDIDKKAYTAIVGKSMLILGLGCILSALTAIFFFDGIVIMVPFGVSFAIWLVMWLYAQFKYNHGIF